VELILDALDTATRETAREFDGTIRFSNGDSCCISFGEAGQAIAGAERLIHRWDAEQVGCSIGIGMHHGAIYTYRSFLFGRDVQIASQLQHASARLLKKRESGVFVTGAVRDALLGMPWHNRFEPVLLPQLQASLASGVEFFRLQV
jgi:class 3 adenylate cyclase